MSDPQKPQSEESQPAFPLAQKRQRGYDQDEVDHFLERARETYDGELTGSQRVTSETVRNTAFSLTTHWLRSTLRRCCSRSS